MKKTMLNFRLSSQSLNRLSLLEKKLHISKTAVVEQALEFYAEKTLSKKTPLLKYAGILNEQEADTMLAAIRRSRQDKAIAPDL